MASLVLKNVNLDFPVHTSNVSLKKDVVNFMRKFAKHPLKAVSKNKEVFRSLDNINLQFEEGDKVGLIGPNGSGKTTLLRVMAGIYFPTSGLCEVKGSISALIDIGFGMHPDLTGYENIRTQLLLNKVPKKNLHPIIEDIIEFSELGDFIHRPLKTYSSGMGMKLCFSTATAVNSSILLMDEWLSAGDFSFTNKAKARIDHFANQCKILIFGTHDLSLVKKVCNKAIYIREGKIRHYGTVDDAIAQYRNDFTN